MRCDLRRQQKIEREGGNSFVRWKTVPQTNGCNRKRTCKRVEGQGWKIANAVLNLLAIMTHI